MNFLKKVEPTIIKRTDSQKKAKKSELPLSVFIAVLYGILITCFREMMVQSHNFADYDNAYAQLSRDMIKQSPVTENIQRTWESVDDATEDTAESESESESVSDIVPIRTETQEGICYRFDDYEMTIDFDGLKAINEDFVGWLYLPNRKNNKEISYPVVQGSDNKHYLRHQFDGVGYSLSGTLFFDYRIDFARDDNFIVYGHNMKNNTMFSELLRYDNQSYYDENPYFYYLTEDTVYRIRIFSAYETTLYDVIYNISFVNYNAFLLWQDEIVSKSEVKTDVTLNEFDRIFTLSTCGDEGGNARFVVAGKMEKIT